MTGRAFPWHKRWSELRRHEQPPFRGQDRSHRPSSPHTPWERSRPRTGTGHGDDCCYAKNRTEQSSWHKRRSGLCRHGQPLFRARGIATAVATRRTRADRAAGISAEPDSVGTGSHLFAVKTAPTGRAIHTHRGSGLARERARCARRHALLAGIRAWPTSKRLANE